MKQSVKGSKCQTCKADCKKETLDCYICKGRVHYSCYKSQGEVALTAEQFETSSNLYNFKWFCSKCKKVPVTKIVESTSQHVIEHISKSRKFFGNSEYGKEKNNTDADEVTELTSNSVTMLDSRVKALRTDKHNNSVPEMTDDIYNSSFNYSVISDDSIINKGYSSAPENSTVIDKLNRIVSAEKNKFIEEARKGCRNTYIDHNPVGGSRVFCQVGTQTAPALGLSYSELSDNQPGQFMGDFDKVSTPKHFPGLQKEIGAQIKAAIKDQMNLVQDTIEKAIFISYLACSRQISME